MNKFKRKLITVMAVVACSVCINGKAFIACADENVVEPIVAETSAKTGDISTGVLLSDETVEMEENKHQNEKESDVDEKEDGKTSIDDFLGIMQDKADEYGIGEEWREDLENIRYAVKEKKFDTLFWWSIGHTLLLLAYIIYKVIRDVSIKKLKQLIEELKQLIYKLAEISNKLVDEAKGVEKEEKDIEERQKRYTKAMEYTNEALSQMVDGINFTPEKKTAALRKLNKAIKYLDEGGKHDGTTQ